MMAFLTLEVGLHHCYYNSFKCRQN